MAKKDIKLRGKISLLRVRALSKSNNRVGQASMNPKIVPNNIRLTVFVFSNHA